MSKSHKYSIYPIHTAIVELFLKENGFIATYISEHFIEWENGTGDLQFKIPKQEKLTQEEVKSLLESAGLKYKDFDWFLLQHGADFDELLKRSNK